MLENKCTKSEWCPEAEPPTYNPEASAYQRAIIQLDHGRVIPGFSFGESAEECTANGWMMAASKDLFKAVHALLKNEPDMYQKAEYALSKAMGEAETNSVSFGIKFGLERK